MSFKTSLSALLVVGLLLVACQNETNPVQTYTLNSRALKQLVLPVGAQLESAVFYIYVHEANGQTVNIHRVTEFWDETSVTWSSFGGAYDPGVMNSFLADATGWRSADITPLVQGWLDGLYDNFGILLDQAELAYPRANYYAREFGSNQPLLELCYIMPDGRVCEQTISIADAYIWEANPGTNYGGRDLLYTGWFDLNDFEKQSLLLFEVGQEIVIGGCTHTKGYWDNWDGLENRPDIVTRHLPIWMGTPGGAHSFQVTNVYESSSILGMNLDTPKNGIVRMMAQLLCAKLNISTGADDSEIIDIVNTADAFLANHSYTGWYDLDDNTQMMVLRWLVALNMWNAGEFGPGRCIDYYNK